MQSMSKSFYIGSWLGGMIGYIALLAVGVGVIVADEDLAPLGALLMLLGVGLLIYAVVILAVLIYRMWQAIQAGNPRTTPGKAVGFCFIPFFNLYWVFQAYWGWAQDYNRFARERGAAHQVSESLALVLCIFTVLSMIPYLGMLFGLANLVLLTVFISQVCDGVNALGNSPPTAGAAQL